MARHGHPSRPGDGLVRAGVVLFLAGLVAIGVIFVPFGIDLVRHGARVAQSPRHEHGVALNLATFSACVGLGVALVGLVRQARASRRVQIGDLDAAGEQPVPR